MAGNASAGCSRPWVRLLIRRRWWVILHELVYSFVQILLTFLGACFGIQGLARYSSPDQVVVRWIVHVDRELPLEDHRRICSDRRPARSNTVAAQLGKSPFYTLIGLVTNQQIDRAVTFNLLKALLRECSLQSSLDLLVREFINRLFALESDPLVHLELRKVDRLIEVEFYALT